jgi:CHAD domain-containing protein
MASPKWIIKGLDAKYSYKKSAHIIIKERITNLKGSIKTLLKDYTPENLHEVRISLRRLRYNIELFYNLFERKKFLKLYAIIEKLQDITGNVRDIYLLKKNILLFGLEEEKSFLEKIIDKIEEKEKLLNDELKLEISSFIHSTELKNFMKLIK